MRALGCACKRDIILNHAIVWYSGQFLSSPYFTSSFTPLTRLLLGGWINGIQKLEQARTVQRNRLVLLPICKLPLLNFYSALVTEK